MIGVSMMLANSKVKSFGTLPPSFLLFMILLGLCVMSGARGTHVTSLNFFHSNDFNTCETSTPDRVITLIDDGTCYELVPSDLSKDLEAWYYRTHEDSFVGLYSNLTYNLKSLYILDRCNCEHIVSRTGHRVYNRTCMVAKLYQPCQTFKLNKKTKLVWGRRFNDKDLKLWGIDVNYLQDFMLY